MKTAFDWVDDLYKRSMAATGHSWTRLNGALSEAVGIAIGAGLAFGKKDFRNLHDKCEGGYWFGENNGEHWYSHAVQANNISACQAYESFRERPPFMFGGRRLYCGADMTWDGHRCQVTSFDDLGEYVTAVVRRNEGHTTKVVKRFKVSLEELRAGERAKEPPRIPAEIRDFIRFADCGCRKQFERDALKAKSLKDVWAMLDDEYVATNLYGVDNVRRFLVTHLRYDGQVQTVNGWQTMADLKRDVDFDRDLVPLIKVFVAKKKAEQKEQKLQRRAAS